MNSARIVELEKALLVAADALSSAGRANDAFVATAWVTAPDVARAKLSGAEHPIQPQPWDACPHHPDDESARRRCGCWSWETKQPKLDSYRASKLVRDKGGCGYITPAEPSDLACIMPIGHDDNVHECIRPNDEPRAPEACGKLCGYGPGIRGMGNCKLDKDHNGACIARRGMDPNWPAPEQVKCRLCSKKCRYLIFDGATSTWLSGFCDVHGSSALYPETSIPVPTKKP